MDNTFEYEAGVNQLGQPQIPMSQEHDENMAPAFDRMNFEE